MKFRLALLALVSAVSCQLSVAQTTNVPPPFLPPPSSITNGLSFTNVTLEFYTGAGYAAGSTTAIQSKTGISYDLFSGFGPSIEIANEATGNVIAEMDAFFEYHKRTGNFEIVAGLGAGYNWDTRGTRGIGALGLNYNLTQIGSTFEYIGTRLEISDDFKTGGRPTLTPMAVFGVGY